NIWIFVLLLGSGTTNSELFGAILTCAAGERTLFQAYCSTPITLSEEITFIKILKKHSIIKY
ncbi:MAG: hypothetical protein RR954_05240, partial [Christensenellaceae bacterium]